MPTFRRTCLSIAAILATTLLMSTTGCGLLLTHGPPAEHEQMVSFSCTEGDTGPILDAIWASVSLALAVMAAGTPDDYAYDQGATVAAALGWAAVMGASAVVGFDKTSKCRKAKQAMSKRLEQSDAPPGRVDALQIDALTQSVTVTPAQTPLPRRDHIPPAQ
jgi:hypothetical protein